LNNTGKEDIRDGRFPRYQRWRLEAGEITTQSSFLIALSPKPDQVRYTDGAILLPDGGGIRLGYGTLQALGVECECECLMWDETGGQITTLGLRSMQRGEGRLSFGTPLDVDFNTKTGEGVLYAQGALQPVEARGFDVGPWTPVTSEAWMTHNTYRAPFRRI
jgi:hypothetical protein